MRDLADLLAPVRIEDFFRDHWETAPLHVSHGHDAHMGLVSTRDLEALIAATPADTPRDSAHGAVASATTVDGQTLREPIPLDDTGQVRIAGVYAALAEGRSIVIRHVRRSWAPVSLFCARVEHDLGQPVNANLFLTPAGGTAFPLHFDRADTFFVQLEGSKTWTVHEPQTVLAHDATADPDLSRLGAAHEFTLEPGDVLFLPRGWIHGGTAGDVASLHLTVGTIPIRWVDLLHAAVDQAAYADVELRRAIPPDRWRNASGASVQADLEALLARVGSVSADQVMADLVADIMASLPPTHASHADAVLHIDRVDESTTIELRPGLGPLVRFTPGASHIHLAGGAVSGPEQAHPAMAFLAEHRCVSVGELPIDPAGRVPFARALILEGLVDVIDGHNGGATG